MLVRLSLEPRCQPTLELFDNIYHEAFQNWRGKDHERELGLHTTITQKSREK
jgi:hypothetical protein